MATRRGHDVDTWYNHVFMKISRANEADSERCELLHEFMQLFDNDLTFLIPAEKQVEKGEKIHGINIWQYSMGINSGYRYRCGLRYAK